ncbi:outer membrane beta-barrel protein [bacterium]|nr:outer membrane beta-barrel protein [bacterium]
MTRFTSKLLCVIVIGTCHTTLLFAQNPDSSNVAFGGFIDTYFAYDFDKPAQRDRGYTTQPARHNEFNINLAFVEARLAGERMRGRLALQTGTSVNFNYAAEVNNRELAQLIQEAVAGFRVTDGLWIDAGIYLSHIGLESWISRDNWTYTRSLCSEYSPYYQSGVKATWQTSQRLAVQFHVLNGWQNLAETNNGKALGLQAAFTPSEKFSLTYNNFFGNEQSDSLASRTRFFNDIVLKFALNPSAQIAGVFDLGLEEKPSGSGNSTWYTALLLGRFEATSSLAFTGRIEYFSDKDQVIVKTGTLGGFQTFGASLTADVKVAPGMLWRAEVRMFNSKNHIFPTNNATAFSRDNAFIVSSITLSF